MYAKCFSKDLMRPLRGYVLGMLPIYQHTKIQLIYKISWVKAISVFAKLSWKCWYIFCTYTPKDSFLKV